MSLASFEELLKTILIILLVYFAVRILIKWYGAAILRYVLKKLGQKITRRYAQQQSSDNYQSTKTKKANVDKNAVKQRKSKKDVGEYIDYEEID